MGIVNELKSELMKLASEERRIKSQSYFKTGKGEYGEGDVFLGVSVPNVRNVAKKFKDMTFHDIGIALSSKIHEIRQAALFVLTERFEKSMKKKDIKIQKEILKFYKKNLKYVNNWDLVDWSAPRIIGYSILSGLEKNDLLEKYAESKDLWERRIAIISTLTLISKKRFDESILISKKLLKDKEDLIHKAVGWCIREIWKRDSTIAEKFIIKNYKLIPRTALRYAIEKMDKKKKKGFLEGNFY